MKARKRARLGHVGNEVKRKRFDKSCDDILETTRLYHQHGRALVSTSDDRCNSSFLLTNLSKFSAVSSYYVVKVPFLTYPLCGVSKTMLLAFASQSSLHHRLLAGRDSMLNTLRAAPRMRLCRSVSSNAASSTSGLREVLIRLPVGSVGSTGSRTCVNCVVFVLRELRFIHPSANVVGAKPCIYWPVSEDGMEPGSCTLEAHTVANRFHPLQLLCADNASRAFAEDVVYDHHVRGA
jgi:hypothetical protein